MKRFRAIFGSYLGYLFLHSLPFPVEMMIPTLPSQAHQAEYAEQTNIRGAFELTTVRRHAAEGLGFAVTERVAARLGVQNLSCRRR